VGRRKQSECECENGSESGYESGNESGSWWNEQQSAVLYTKSGSVIERSGIGIERNGIGIERNGIERSGIGIEESENCRGSEAAFHADRGARALAAWCLESALRLENDCDFGSACLCEANVHQRQAGQRCGCADLRADLRAGKKSVMPAAAAGVEADSPTMGDASKTPRSTARSTVESNTHFPTTPQRSHRRVVRWTWCMCSE
jgi:hypothetical protein